MPLIIDYNVNLDGKASSGQPYSLKCINNSGRTWTFYVYQKSTDTTSEMLSLAWFASPYKIRHGDYITFKWNIDYNFVWGNTGDLVPGVTFEAGGEKDATPDDKNSTEFDIASGAPGLSDPVEDPKNTGTLVINDGENIPDNVFSVGIGMSGTGTFVVQAGPNLHHLFTPTPVYWVAAANEMQIGKVLDIQTITNTSEVDYPKNIYNMIASLDDSYKWQISKA